MPSDGFWSRFRGRINPPPAEQTGGRKQTEEELKQDQETVTKAISEAVTTALNNDDFTKAVAVQLALQLQPSLKAALDISTVEENLSKRLDEIQTATTARLSEISNDLNSYKSSNKTSTLEEAVNNVDVLLNTLGKDVKTIQERISQQTTRLDGITTDLKTLQQEGPVSVRSAFSNQSSRLSDLAAELNTIQERIASLDTSLLSSHTTKLDAIAAEIVAVKENNETAIALKTVTSDLEGLTTQISSIQSAVDAQNITLSEIKSADSSSDILRGIKVSNESHAAHAKALADIKTATSTPAEKVRCPTASKLQLILTLRTCRSTYPLLRQTLRLSWRALNLKRVLLLKSRPSPVLLRPLPRK
jgi:hypothetical protein